MSKHLYMHGGIEVNLKYLLVMTLHHVEANGMRERLLKAVGITEGPDARMELERFYKDMEKHRNPKTTV